MEATRKWWREVRTRFDLFTTEVVLVEASRGDPQAAAERMEVLMGVALVPVPAEVNALADLLLARGALPLKPAWMPSILPWLLQTALIICSPGTGKREFAQELSRRAVTMALSRRSSARLAS